MTKQLTVLSLRENILKTINYVVSTAVNFAISRSKSVFLLTIISFCVTAPGLAKLEIAPNAHDLLARSSGIHKDREQVEAVLGPGSNALIGISFEDEEHFVRQAWSIVDALSDEIRSSKESIASTSIATEPIGSLHPGREIFSTFTKPQPETSFERSKHHKILTSLSEFEGIYKNTSSLGTLTGTSILVRIESKAERKAIQEIVTTFQAQNPRVKFLFVGDLIAQEFLQEDILVNLLALFMASGAVAYVLLIIVMKDAYVALFPVIKVAFASVVGFGLCGYVGFALHIPVLAVPAVLVAVGLLDSMQITATADILKRRSGLKINEIVEKSIEANALPILCTSLSTGVAFASFLATDIPALESFAIVSILATAVMLLWMLFVLPALLIHARRLQTARDYVPGDPFEAKVSTKVTGVVTARFWRYINTIVLLTILVFAFLPLGSIRINDSWTSSFPRTSDYLARTVAFEREFTGTSSFRILIRSKQHENSDLYLVPLEQGARAGDQEEESFFPRYFSLDEGSGPAKKKIRIGDRYVVEASVGERMGRLFSVKVEAVEEGEGKSEFLFVRDGDLESPNIVSEAWGRYEYQIQENSFLVNDHMAMLGQVERDIDAFLGEAGRAFGGYGLLKTTHRIFYGDRDFESRLVSGNVGFTRDLVNLTQSARGLSTLNRFFPDGGNGVGMMIFVKSSDFQSMSSIEHEVRRSVFLRLGPDYEVVFSGDGAVSVGAVSSVLRTLLFSTISTVGVCGALIYVLCGSKMLTMLIVAAQVWVLSCGLFFVKFFQNGEIGIALSLFPALIVGLGIDFYLHYFFRIRDLSKEDKYIASDSLERCIRTNLKAAVILLAMFLILFLSKVPPTSSLGALLTVGVVASWLIFSIQYRLIDETRGSLV